ncbi:Heterogeneous Nuclear Ribonucleoprotein U-Like Protein 1 [Manis pentadactyla]|nr:Heterogeneous Nuclear Ribonucleoprotein U-Like Protein 1 [Manis pentadactyla]
MRVEVVLVLPDQGRRKGFQNPKAKTSCEILVWAAAAQDDSAKKGAWKISFLTSSTSSLGSASHPTNQSRRFVSVHLCVPVKACRDRCPQKTLRNVR